MTNKILRRINLLFLISFVGCSDSVVPNQSLGEKLPSLSIAELISVKSDQKIHEWPDSLYRAFPKNVIDNHPRSNNEPYDSVIRMTISELKKARLDFTGYFKEPTLKAKWANLELIRRYFHSGRYDDAVDLLEDVKYKNYFKLYLAMIYENEGRLHEATNALAGQYLRDSIAFCRPEGYISFRQVHLPLYLLQNPDASPLTYYEHYKIYTGSDETPFTHGDWCYREICQKNDQIVKKQGIKSIDLDYLLRHGWPKFSTDDSDFISNYFFPEYVNNKHSQLDNNL